jgi:membrane protein implicated in regulation of membrane protease activity
VKSPHLRALIRMVLYITVIGAAFTGVGMTLDYIYANFGIAGTVKTVAAIICVIVGHKWYSLLLEEERSKDHEG